MSLYTQQALTRIDNFPAGQKWMLDHRDQWSILLQDNRAQFACCWGRHLCTFTNDYRHWVWNPMPNLWVLSGKKGTYIEVSHDIDPTHIPSMLDFILHTLLDEDRE